MKKIAILTAGLFVASFATSAMADVDVTATIKKDVNVKVDEYQDIDKEVYLNIQQIAKPTNSAEARAVKNDTNQSNKVTEKPTEVTPPSNSAAPVPTPAITENKATIDGGSANGASGVININQSPGNLNNQGNAAAIAYTATGNAVLHSESSADMVNGGTVTTPESTTTTTDSKGNTTTTTVFTTTPAGNELQSIKPSKTDTINGSLVGATGIIGVNQSAGHMNNQDNATSLAVGIGSIAAISEADLGMVNAYNVSNEVDGVKTDIITAGALGTAKGIINVNQSSGSMNNQANVVSAAMLLFP